MVKPNVKSNKEILRQRFVQKERRLRREANRTYVKLALGKAESLTNLIKQAHGRIALYPYMSMRNSDNTTNYRFYFPFPPLEVQYTNFGDEITQVPRPGTTPLLVFKSHRLKQVQFEFVVAVPKDGVSIHIEDSLALLQAMASRGDLNLRFHNMDSLFMTKITLRNETNFNQNSNVAVFKIMDMSFTAVQRNLLNKITFAKVSMTIVENHNPTITYVKIPPIGKPVSIDKPKTGKGKKGGTTVEKISTTMANLTPEQKALRLNQLMQEEAKIKARRKVK